MPEASPVDHIFSTMTGSQGTAMFKAAVALDVFTAIAPPSFQRVLLSTK